MAERASAEHEASFSDHSRRQQEVEPYAELITWLQSVDPPSSFSRFNTVLSVGLQCFFRLHSSPRVAMVLVRQRTNASHRPQGVQHVVQPNVPERSQKTV